MGEKRKRKSTVSFVSFDVGRQRFDAFAQGLFGFAASAACFCARSIAVLLGRGVIMGTCRLLGRRALLVGEVTPFGSSSLSLDVVLAVLSGPVPVPLLEV